MARSKKSLPDLPAPEEPREVRSWEELRANVGVLLDAINNDPELARGAAANPLLALEELGYRVAPEARAAIEDRFRFPYRTATRLRTLRRQLVAIAKRDFDPDSPTELHALLFGDLKLRPVLTPSSERAKGRSSTDQLPVQVRWSAAVSDPLTSLRGRHPIIEPLLEYRQLEASAARLAPSDLYQDIRAGRVKIPVTRLRGRLKREVAPKAPAADA